MHLAPIIERYMDLKRQESAVYSDFDLMELRTSVPADEYYEVSAILSANIGLLHEPAFSGLSQSLQSNIATHEAELAAMNALLLEKWEKTQEMHNKMMEIKRKKDEIKVLLRQM